MKRLGSVTLLIGALILSLGLFGLFGMGQAAAQDEMMMPAPEADAVWEYITQTSPYTEWGTWPDEAFEGYLPSGAPHTQVVKIYVNDVGLSVAEEFPGEMPDGTFIVKDNFMGESVDSPGDLGAVTIMYKVEGYNPDGNDWYWAKYQADGGVDAAGKPAGCIGCHLGIPDNRDGVLRWGFEAEPVVASAAGSDAVANVMQQMQQPEQMPETGSTPNQNLIILAIVAGGLLILAGFTLRRKAVTIR